MRKLMNKKGFSLVELMIVVVIMGILIAVAIPLYGAIKDNANNKTCLNNIKTIKSNAANYMASYNQKAPNVEAIATMFDDQQMPSCPLGGSYSVYIQDNGSALVNCSVDKDSGASGDIHTKQVGDAKQSGTALQPAA